MKKETPHLQFASRQAFRAWLAQNAQSSEGVWLVFGKTAAVKTMRAAEALEEALCFGWIDGQMQRIDETSYRKYFKQRSSTSNWSEKNRKLVQTLEQGGLMTDLGRAKIELAKQNGSWEQSQKPEVITPELMEQFCELIRPFDSAYSNWMGMAPSVRKTYAASYFFGAKTEEGKQKRLATILERLAYNLDPMQSLSKAKQALCAADDE